MSGMLKLKPSVNAVNATFPQINPQLLGNFYERRVYFFLAMVYAAHKGVPISVAFAPKVKRFIEFAKNDVREVFDANVRVVEVAA